MKLADYLTQADKFTVTVDRTEEGWQRITLETEGVEPKAFTVHGSVVTEEE